MVNPEAKKLAIVETNGAFFREYVGQLLTGGMCSGKMHNAINKFRQRVREILPSNDNGDLFSEGTLKSLAAMIVPADNLGLFGQPVFPGEMEVNGLYAKQLFSFFVDIFVPTEGSNRQEDILFRASTLAHWQAIRSAYTEYRNGHNKEGFVSPIAERDLFGDYNPVNSKSEEIRKAGNIFTGENLTALIDCGILSPLEAKHLFRERKLAGDDQFNSLYILKNSFLLAHLLNSVINSNKTTGRMDLTLALTVMTDALIKHRDSLLSGENGGTDKEKLEATSILINSINDCFDKLGESDLDNSDKSETSAASTVVFKDPVVSLANGFDDDGNTSLVYPPPMINRGFITSALFPNSVWVKGGSPQLDRLFEEAPWGRFLMMHTYLLKIRHNEMAVMAAADAGAVTTAIMNLVTGGDYSETEQSAFLQAPPDGLALADCLHQLCPQLVELGFLSSLEQADNELADYLVFNSLRRLKAMPLPENKWIEPIIGFNEMEQMVLLGKMADRYRPDNQHTFRQLIMAYESLKPNEERSAFDYKGYISEVEGWFGRDPTIRALADDIIQAHMVWTIQKKEEKDRFLFEAMTTFALVGPPGSGKTVVVRKLNEIAAKHLNTVGQEMLFIEVPAGGISTEAFKGKSVAELVSMAIIEKVMRHFHNGTMDMEEAINYINEHPGDFSILLNLDEWLNRAAGMGGDAGQQTVRHNISLEGLNYFNSRKMPIQIDIVLPNGGKKSLTLRLDNLGLTFVTGSLESYARQLNVENLTNSHMKLLLPPDVSTRFFSGRIYVFGAPTLEQMVDAFNLPKHGYKEAVACYLSRIIESFYNLEVMVTVEDGVEAVVKKFLQSHIEDPGGYRKLSYASNALIGYFVVKHPEIVKQQAQSGGDGGLEFVLTKELTYKALEEWE